jgi:hypothetical protein
MLVEEIERDMFGSSGGLSAVQTGGREKLIAAIVRTGDAGRSRESRDTASRTTPWRWYRGDR